MFVLCGHMFDEEIIMTINEHNENKPIHANTSTPQSGNDKSGNPIRKDAPIGQKPVEAGKGDTHATQGGKPSGAAVKSPKV